MFLSSVAKDLSSVVTDQAKLSESDNNSCGLYEATPPMTSTHTCNDKPSGTETTPSNCIYPSLNHCDEPVSSILHNLTTKTWSKAAERSLMDHNVKTIGDLSKLTAVKASALRSLRPPSNLVAIKEALRKFEKSWIKRGRDKYTEKKLLQNPSAMVEVEEDLTEDEEIKETRFQKMSPVVDDISTPEEEDETMKEIYERPSPSPTDSIGSSIEAKENEVIPTDTNLISEVTTQDQSEQNLSKKEIQEKIDAKIQDQMDAEIQEMRDAEIQEKKDAEIQAKIDAEIQQKQDAEIQAKIDAEIQEKKEAEIQAKKEAEIQAKKEAKLQAKKEAKIQAEKEAEIQAKKDAEIQAKKEAKIQAKKEAKIQAKKDAKIQAEIQAKKDAEIQAKIDFDIQQKKDAEIQAKIDAENQERMDTESATETPAFTPTPDGIYASVATEEKDVIDASVSTDTKDVIDASVSTDTKELCDVFVETDAKENLQDFQQQTDVEDAKIKLKEFLNVMKDLSISDLTGVISRAAQAINDKSLL